MIWVPETWFLLEVGRISLTEKSGHLNVSYFVIKADIYKNIRVEVVSQTIINNINGRFKSV